MENYCVKLPFFKDYFIVEYRLRVRLSDFFLSRAKKKELYTYTAQACHETEKMFIELLLRELFYHILESDSCAKRTCLQVGYIVLDMFVIALPMG